MAKKQISIKLLQVGMHIVKLDIPWMDSPFFRNQLTIKKQDEISKLVESGVKSVTIDTEKGIDVAGQVEVVDNTDEQDAPESEPELASDQNVPLDKELEIAKALKNSFITFSEEINESLKNEEPVDFQLVYPMIESTIHSLKRNDQAMMTLVNMQRNSAGLSEHAFATFSLSINTAIKMGYPKEEQEIIGIAALLHDTGWLKLPQNLLSKNKAFNESEQALSQQHIAIGLKVLTSSGSIPALSARIIEEHHESNDGSGYPSGLTNLDIHPLSQLFRVIDFYDELVHGLLDRPALTPNGALSVIYKDTIAGTLSSDVFSAFVSTLSVYPIGSVVLLSSNEKAVVCEINRDHAKQPKVKVFYDASSIAHSEPRLVDLSKQNLDAVLSIQKVLDVHEEGVDPCHLLELRVE